MAAASTIVVDTGAEAGTVVAVVVPWVNKQAVDQQARCKVVGCMIKATDHIAFVVAGADKWAQGCMWELALA